ncbi:sensor histidine kinase [soil metagenome]
MLILNRTTPSSFWRHFSGLFLLCLVFAMGFAGSARAADSRSLRFDNLAKLAPGLPENAVTALIQDKHGYLWIGSYIGLFRFDGYRSVHYKHEGNNPNSLAADRVNALYEDDKGRIWVAGNEGLARFEPESNSFKIFAPDGSSGNIRQLKNIVKIIGDGNGGMWVLSKDALLHFDPDSGKFRFFTHDNARPDSLSADIFHDMVLDARRGLWIASESSGIDYLPPDTSSFQHYLLDATAPSGTSNNVRTLYIDRQQRLWIGSASGVFLWDRKTGWLDKKHLVTPPGVDDFTTRAIFEDTSGTIWIGAEAGLFTWDQQAQQFSAYQYWSGDPYGLPPGAVTLIRQDRSGTLWVGVWKAGVSRVDLATHGFARYFPRAVDASSGIFSNAVGSIAGNGQGQLWLGSMGAGLVLFDPKSNKLLATYRYDAKEKNSLNTDNVASLYYQPDGILWVGTSAGLNRFDTKTGQFSAVHFDSRLTDVVRKIIPGRDNVLWLGTEGGLIRYQTITGEYRYFKHDPTDPGSRAVNYTSFLMEDREGRLWVSGFNGGGIDLLDRKTGKFRHFRHDKNNIGSLISDDIRGFYQDSQGQIWISTLLGVSRAIPRPDGDVQFFVLNPRNGAAQSSQYGAILGDTTGDLWITNQFGISRFDVRTGNATNFIASNGLTDGRFYDRAYYLDQGVLYFGGYKGMTGVTPAQVRLNMTPPLIAITDITIFNRPVQQASAPQGLRLEGAAFAPKSLSLSWKESVFSLEFAALHFADPANNRYTYRLIGFDDHWTETDSGHRSATYTNLNPGTYQFQVKGSNSNGAWNDVGFTLPITITPPYWRTWWFLSIALLTLVAGVYFLYRRRVHFLHAQKDALQHEVGLRTHELLMANELLQQEGQKLKDADRFKSEFISVVSHELRTPLTSIRGSLGLLESGRIVELPKAALDLIKIANRNCQRLVGLVNDILDLEKIQSGALSLSMRPADLIALAKQSIDENAAYAESHDVAYQLEETLGEAWVLADTDRLLQVFANLLSNAAKFAPPQTLVEIKISQVPASFLVEVKDYGAGIPVDFRDRIFGKFAQADGSNLRQQGGTGLGLNITKTLVEKMGGEIGFSSVERVETIFWFTLPKVALAENSSLTSKP